MISIKLFSLFFVLSLTSTVVISTRDEVNAFLASQNPDDLSFRTKLAIKLYLDNTPSLKT